MKTQVNPHHLPESYRLFLDQIKAHIPPDRIIHDPLGTLAYGTDASFYRLIPKIVIKADNEAEVGLILQAANRQRLPVTFRAAGTSLSRMSREAPSDSPPIQFIRACSP